MLSQQQRKLLAYLYAFFFVLAIFFVRYALNQDLVDLDAKDDPLENLVLTRLVDVTLNLYPDPIQEESVDSFKLKMSNHDSVLDFLSRLRSKGFLLYEIVAYTDHLEIVHVNHIYPQFGESWRLFFNGEDITNRLKDIHLNQSDVFDLKLIRTEAPR